jgi:hypothetical protein
VSRAQFVLALLISAVAALLPLALVAWMTSGSWSPSRVRLLDLVLVIPMLGAVKVGLGRTAALVFSFLTYWVIALAVLAWYIKSTSLEIRPKRKDRGAV